MFREIKQCFLPLACKFDFNSWLIDLSALVLPFNWYSRLKIVIPTFVLQRADVTELWIIQNCILFFLSLALLVQTFLAL